MEPEQSGHESNGNEKSTSHFPDLKNWSLKTKCSLWEGKGFYLSAGDTISIYQVPLTGQLIVK